MNESEAFKPDAGAAPLDIRADHFQQLVPPPPPPLDEVEFLEPNVPVRRPGPGLPESLLWTLGIVIFQISMGLVAAVVLIIGLMASGPIRSPDELMAQVEDLNPNGQLLFFGLPNLLAFAALIGLGCWRLGRPPTWKLNLSPPSFTQLAILASVVLPLGIVSDALWKPAAELWHEVVKVYPALNLMEESNIMKFLEGIEGASLPLLLFFLAVVPAIGEEFMLRGLIGRGLVARWGLVWGVLITSCLFAGLHMYPPHVAAIFPVGIMLHITYLTTRSFWTPVLFHFMNNGFAALYTALGLSSTESGATVETPSGGHDWLTYVAPAYVLLCGWLLWKYRTEYVDESGTPVWPGYHSVEHPNPTLGLRRSAPNNVLVAMLFSLLFVGEMGLVASDVYEELQAAPAATDEQDSAAQLLGTGGQASRVLIATFGRVSRPASYVTAPPQRT